MPQIVARYPHFTDTMVPRPLAAPVIWAIAAEVRRQTIGHLGHTPINPDQIVARSFVRARMERYEFLSRPRCHRH